MRGAKIGGRVFRTVKRPELRGVAVAAEDEVGASGSTIFTLAVLASSLNSWPLLGSIASWTWRASCNLSSEEARPPRAATSPTFTGSLSLDLARLLANFNILSQSKWLTSLLHRDHCTPVRNMKLRGDAKRSVVSAQVVRALAALVLPRYAESTTTTGHRRHRPTVLSRPAGG